MSEIKPSLSSVTNDLIPMSPNHPAIITLLEKFAVRSNDPDLCPSSNRYYQGLHNLLADHQWFAKAVNHQACSRCIDAKYDFPGLCILAVDKDGQPDPTQKCLRCYMSKQICNSPSRPNLPLKPRRHINSSSNRNRKPITKHKPESENYLIGPQRYFSEQLDKLKPGHPEHQKFSRLAKDLEKIQHELEKSKPPAIRDVRKNQPQRQQAAGPSVEHKEVIDLTDDSLESICSEEDCKEVIDQLIGEV